MQSLQTRHIAAFATDLTAEDLIITEDNIESVKRFSSYFKRKYEKTCTKGASLLTPTHELKKGEYYLKEGTTVAQLWLEQAIEKIIYIFEEDNSSIRTAKAVL